MQLGKKVKTFLFWYQKQMWYFQTTVAEAKKPLQFANEALLILTFLTVRGVEVEFKEMILIYLGVILGFIILGKILVSLGVLQFINKFGNSQNPELLEILQRVKNIEKKYETD